MFRYYIRYIVRLKILTFKFNFVVVVEITNITYSTTIAKETNLQRCMRSLKCEPHEEGIVIAVLNYLLCTLLKQVLINRQITKLNV